MKTTNELLDETIANVKQLMELAEADIQHSRESDAPRQAQLDIRRWNTLSKALDYLEGARK